MDLTYFERLNFVSKVKQEKKEQRRVFLFFSWGRDFSSPPQFSDMLNSCEEKVSLGEARRHRSQDGLLKRKRLRIWGKSLARV